MAEARVGCLSALELPARLTLRSSDGALDIDTAVTIQATQADLAWVNVDLTRSALEPWNARLADLISGVATPDAGLIKISGSAEGGSLAISRLSPLSPSTVSDDINAARLNNPDFLGASRSVAEGSW